MVGNIGSLNPLFEQNGNDQDVDRLVYQGLTAVGPKQTAVPALARSWSVSEDGLTYTCHLKSGVSWADGRPFTADDVLFTYSVLQSDAYTVPTQQFWKAIQVTKVDQATVRFTLKAPSAAFPLALGQGIIPKHIFNGKSVAQIQDDSHSGARALGTGPFKVAGISSDRRTVVLDRNPYAGPRPYLDHFRFRGYASLAGAVAAVSRGDADTLGTLQPPPQLATTLGKSADLVVHQIKTFSLAAVLISLTPDQATYFPAGVRQALARAVDRQKIITDVLGGGAEVDYGPIPPSDWSYAPASAAKVSYDPRAARQMLDAAGWTLNARTGLRERNGKPFSVTLLTTNQPPWGQVAQAVRNQLRKVGVDAATEPVSAGDLVNRYLMPRQFQMALTVVDNGPDPDQYSLWHSGDGQGGLGLGGYLPRQALIDKDLEDGRAASNRKTRQAVYADFQELMAEAAPAIFI
ncbi:MAG: peptide ABC transporter substrate-binding protein, partial [Candidatus Dormibacteraeota bacterium]|nr:peptide ABC transporter substrate-binding protein [Candidatus Dormibacteraeota bacterium]